MALSHLVVFACVYPSSPQDPFWSFGERNERVEVVICDVVSIGAGPVSTYTLTAQKVGFMWLLEVMDHHFFPISCPLSTKKKHTFVKLHKLIN